MKNLLILSLIIILAACSTDDSLSSSPSLNLVLLEETTLDVSEPSDLCYDETSHSLWTVSDNTNHIYKLNFNGNIIEELNFSGEDLEGIIYDSNNNSLWVAEENLSRIINVSVTGKELASYNLPVPTGTNSGLEGICFNYEHNICLVKEKNPGKFFRLTQDYNVATELELTFAGDYAAITYDVERECFWIVSDQEQQVYLWNETEGVITEFPLPFPKPEGICLIPNSSILYLVSDSENMLYKMELKEQYR